MPKVRTFLLSLWSRTKMLGLTVSNVSMSRRFLETIWQHGLLGGRLWDTTPSKGQRQMNIQQLDLLAGPTVAFRS